jgi:S1-C subfamily serine protease
MRTRRRIGLGGLALLMLSAVLGCAAPVATGGAGGLAAGSALRGVSATAFGVDGAGHLLTAAHAVASCRSLFVTKAGRVVAAEVVARSDDHDVALLKVPYPLGPPATLHAAPAVPSGMVFVARYDGLAALADTGGGLFNAVLMRAEDGLADIDLVSDAGSGTSGAPVLDGGGLVVGMMIARRPGANRAVALSAEVLRAFLDAQGVETPVGAAPQMAPFQDRAARAATLSAGLRCYRD